MFKLADIFKKSASVEVTRDGNPVDVIRGLFEGIVLNSIEGQTDAFHSNPYVHRAITLRASTVSSIDPVLYDADGNAIDNPYHPLMQFLKRPNPRQGWNAFLYDIECELAMHGGAYIWVKTKDQYSPAGAYVIPAENVTIQGSSNILNPVSFYTVNIGLASIRVLPSEIVFIHSKLKADGFSPVSPLESASLAIENQKMARLWNSSLMQNGCKGNAAITIPEKLTYEKYAEFVAKMRANHEGVGNAGSTVILDGGKTITYSGMTAVDMDYTEGTNLCSREIFSALGVPSQLCNDNTNSCYNNVAEAKKQLAIGVVVPELSLICSALTAKFCPIYDDVERIGFDLQQIDGLREQPTIADLTACDWLTTDEKRAVYSYDKVEGGDVILTGMSKVPLSDMFEPAEGEVFGEDDE